MKGRRLGFVDAQLNDRDVRVRKYMAKHRPGAMIQSPLQVHPHRHWRQQLLNSLRKLWMARRRILDLIKLARESAEIVNGARILVGCDSSLGNVPMGRDAENGRVIH